MTVFPNYLEGCGGDEDEVNARITAFVPLEYVFEFLKTGENIPAERLEGARAPITTTDLYSVLEKIADNRTWEFHRYVDGTLGLTARSEGDQPFISIRLLGAGGASQTRVLVSIKENEHEEFPRWHLFVKAGPNGVEVGCSRLVPDTSADGGVPYYDGSKFTFPPAPEDWNIEES